MDHGGHQELEQQNPDTLQRYSLGGGANRGHKSIEVSKLNKADVKRLLMAKGGLIEDLKALALSKGIKSYVKKEDLIDGILRKTKLDELKTFVKKHVI